MAFDEGIDRAAAIGVVGDDGRTTEHRFVQFAGDGQQRVAHLFEIQSPPIRAPQQRIARVDPLLICHLIGLRYARCPLIGARREDQFVQRLRPPTVLDEVIREEIEHVKLHRFLGLQAEVGRVLDERLAEVVHPHAINPDAGRQRIRRRGDRIGQVESTAAMCERGTVGRRKNPQEAARDGSASGTRIAALKDDRIAEDFRVLYDHRTRRGVFVLYGNRVELPKKTAIRIGFPSRQIEGDIARREPHRSVARRE